MNFYISSKKLAGRQSNTIDDNGLYQIMDTRRDNSSYTLPNLLNLSFAMFHLKDSWLSSFKEQ